MRVEDIIKHYWEVTTKRYALNGGRDKSNVMVRHAFCCAVMHNTEVSLSALGRITGRVHASVYHAIRQHKMNYRYEEVYVKLYDEFEEGVLEIIDEHNKDLAERRKNRRYLEAGSEEVTAIISEYEARLEIQEKRLRREQEELKKQFAIVTKALRESQERVKVLNEQALRYKNLL